MVFIVIVWSVIACVLLGAWVSFTIHKQTRLSIATGLVLCLFASLSVHAVWKAKTTGDHVCWHGSLRAIRTLIERGDANDVVVTIDSVLPPDGTYNSNLRDTFYEELHELDSGLVK